MGWIGACNHCGHCGCDMTAGGDSKYYPGISGGKMDFYRQHVSIQPILFQLLKDEFAVQYERPWERGDVEFSLVDFKISGGGPPIEVDVYVSPKGVHKTSTDFSCPFFDTAPPKDCLLWNRQQLPPSCRNYPQFLTNPEAITAWGEEHPHIDDGGTCGWKYEV